MFWYDYLRTSLRFLEEDLTFDPQKLSKNSVNYEGQMMSRRLNNASLSSLIGLDLDIFKWAEKIRFHPKQHLTSIIRGLVDGASTRSCR